MYVYAYTTYYKLYLSAYLARLHSGTVRTTVCTVRMGTGDTLAL